MRAAAFVTGGVVTSLVVGAGVTALLWVVLALLGSQRSAPRYFLSCSALVLVVVGSVMPSGTASGAMGAGEWLVAVRGWVAGGWLLGVVAQLVAIGVSIGRIRAIGARTTPIEDFPELAAAAARWTRLAREMRVRLRVRFRIAAGDGSPFSYGLVRPVVIVPLALLLRLSEDEAEAIVAHELGHIRRYDHLVNAAQVACETLLFFNPFVWWISARIREEREHCADDDAVRASDPVLYARALYRAASAPVPALAAGASGTRLEPRIARILGERRRASVAVLALLLAAALATGNLMGVTATPPRNLDAQAPWYEREAAVIAAATTKDRASFDTLVIALDDENWAIRQRAIHALRQYGADATEPLVVHVDDVNWALRTDIVTTLGEIGDPRALRAIRTRLDDENPSVRTAARDAVVRIAP